MCIRDSFPSVFAIPVLISLIISCGSSNRGLSEVIDVYKRQPMRSVSVPSVPYTGSHRFTIHSGIEYFTLKYFTGSAGSGMGILSLLRAILRRTALTNPFRVRKLRFAASLQASLHTALSGTASTVSYTHLNGYDRSGGILHGQIFAGGQCG